LVSVQRVYKTFHLDTQGNACVLRTRHEDGVARRINAWFSRYQPTWTRIALRFTGLRSLERPVSANEVVC
jgi:hypothetical protein